MENYIHSKSIRVKDPSSWYNNKYITVVMFALTDKTTIRIMFKSSDDFAIYQDVGDWSYDGNLKWAEIFLWNNIPENVSLDWLYTHGYKPF